MSLDWANWMREWIQKHNNAGHIAQPSAFQEFGIQLLMEIMEGSKDPRNEAVDEILDQMIKSGKPPGDAWEDFYPLIFSAAAYTPNRQHQENLAALVISLAHVREGQNKTNASKDETAISEIEDLFSNLTHFGLMSREYWNGPGSMISTYGSPEAARKAWANINGFMAYLSCEQKKNPAEPLLKWVEDFGLWTIVSGLEDKEDVTDHAEAAAAWLIIAGKDILSDPAWGRRDGNDSPGVPRREGPMWSDRLANGDAQETRWEFWKFRLNDLTGEASVDAGARQLAREALEAMVRYETCH